MKIISSDTSPEALEQFIKAQGYSKLHTLLCNSLKSDLETTKVSEDGTVSYIKQRVDKVRNLTIEVRPNAHTPPHFHVISNGINASFSIDNCKHLRGEISNKDKKRIENWYETNKLLIVHAWNETRPSDCPVGIIIED